MRVLSLSVLAFNVLMVAPPSRPTVGERVTTEHFDGLIVDCTMLHSKPDDPPCWAPTRQQVLEMEKGLHAYVVKTLANVPTTLPRRLREYRRQYWGLVEKGQHMIVVIGYHQWTDVVTRELWLNSVVSVAGGGDLFFYCRYNVDIQQFVDFTINAPE